MSGRWQIRKRMKKIWLLCFGTVLILGSVCPVAAADDRDDRILVSSSGGDEEEKSAEDISEEDIDRLTDELLSELSLDDVDEVLATNEGTEDISFSNLVSELLDTDRNLSQTALPGRIVSLAFGELAACRTTFIQILLLTIAFAFFNNFTHVFENSQISRAGFYMCFLVLMALLLKSYLLVSDLFSGVMEQVAEVMQALIPAFCMTMVFASAQTTAAAFYQITIVAIYLVERLLVTIIVPGIHIYVILQMLNCLTGEKMISRFTVLLKKVILWSLRVMLAGVTGINVIENMIAPSMDNLKKLSVTKALGMIPGLGGVTEAAGSIFFGSAVVIKNGVGVAAMIVLVCIALNPLVKILAFDLMYRLTGAIVQPFADTQVCGCIDSVAEGASLLFRAMLTGILLFLITIAVVVTAVR
ncbi:MAG: stage III sporulation protein AE [Clostridiales bacterium]|nr:stage III sporulation protein AE [Clostridiales bacterium]